MLEQYVKKILTSRVYDVAIETPLHGARQLSGRLGNQVLLKREDLQPVFSFKIRGAYNKLAQLRKDEIDSCLGDCLFELILGHTGSTVPEVCKRARIIAASAA